MSQKVADWLEKLGLGQYAANFAENEIDLEHLSDLSDEEMKELGVSIMGHRKKLNQAIKALQENPPIEPVQYQASATSKSQKPAVGTDAQRRQLTVMFCDLVGSTELSENLDPEDMREVNRAYQDACKAAIERYEGYVARYMGDGVLAYFGYPQAHEDDAERAIHAGLSVVEAMAVLNLSLGEQLATEFAVRVGIATGPVVVGDLIGEGASQESAVVGSTPNLAARLQTVAIPNTVVIAPGTHDLVRGRFEFESLGEFKLKGISESVSALQVTGQSRSESRFAAAHRGGFTSLVGREHEIGLVLDRWQQAKEGDGQIVLLSGEAGIGKSRIIEALQDCTAIDNPVRLRYQCSPFHSNSALHPIITQLEHAADLNIEDTAEVKLAKLNSLLNQSKPVDDNMTTLMAALLSIPGSGQNASAEMTAERQKEQTLEGLVKQLEGLSRQQMVLVTFEDVHWADPTSLELLELIIDRAQVIPVVVLITFRPDFQPPWGGYTHITSLTLNRFSSSLAAAMVDKIAGGIPLPGEVLEQIVEKTDGVPLFVEEFTKTILESGLLTRHADQYILSGPLPELAVPATLHDSLMARLDRLGPVKEVAQIAAAIGREFSYDLLAAVSELSFDDLQSALTHLVNAELVFRRGHSEKGGYIFKHALVQDAAYQSVLKSARLQLHARIAEALEQGYANVVAEQPEILAHHYCEAGLFEPAIINWLKAGVQAASRYAHPEAIAYLRLGLGLVAEVDELAASHRMEIELQTALGQSLLAIKGFAAAEVGTVYARAEQLCLLTGNRTSLSDALTGLWYHHVVRGEVKRALEIATRSFTIASEDNDPIRLLVAHQGLSGMMWLGDFEGSCEHVDKALALEPELTKTLNLSIGADARVFVRAFGCHALWHVGEFVRANELSEAGIDRARAMGGPFSLAIALNYAAMMHQFDQNNVVVRRLTEEAIELCTKHQFAYYLAWARIIHGWTTVYTGEVETGIVEMREGLADFGETSAGLRLPYYLSLLADAEAYDGQIEKALATADLALQKANASGENWHNADLHCFKAQLLLQLETAKNNEAESEFQQALKIAREQGCKARELKIATELGRLWLSQGKQDQARNLIKPVYAIFPDSSNSNCVKNARSLLEDL